MSYGKQWYYDWNRRGTIVVLSCLSDTIRTRHRNVWINNEIPKHANAGIDATILER